jgi:type VI secretion system protein ImpI
MVNALECQREGFWDDFAAALGVDIEALDLESREALALNAARLLKHSIEGLQQSLHTLSELKSELHLAVAPDNHKNPLKFASNAGEALSLLLLGDNAGPLSDEQVVYNAFCDLQAHQVALVSASRAAVRGALEHFSPQQLTLRFERDNWTLVSDFGSRWRAFGRYHQALRENDDWIDRLLTGEFAQAYEEQTRLISTLHKYHQGC